MFFSDHGDFTGDYDLVDKTQNTFEDALVPVPFLLKPPRSRASAEGRVSPALCRTADHKYVHRLYERDELYDLREDPAELRNLIDDPGRAPLVADFRQRLLTWFLDTAADVPHDLDAVEWSGLFGPTSTAV